MSSLATACMAVLLSVAGTAWAQAPGAGKVGRSTDDVTTSNAPARDDVGRGGRMGPRLKPGAYIGERHRAALRQAWQKTYGDGRRCPPGLARKAGACEAATPVRWVVGDPLPAGVALKPLPAGMLAHLPPTPPGYRYGVVAGDLLLVGAQSRVVVDGVDRLLGP